MKVEKKRGLEIDAIYVSKLCKAFATRPGHLAVVIAPTVRPPFAARHGVSCLIRSSCDSA